MRTEEGLKVERGLEKLQGADLNGANLRGANLSGANLSGADLLGADLLGANLCRADLSGASLCRASLSEADLYRANLLGANLRWANLSGAELQGANLRGTNLSEANLRGASLLGANLSEANLSGAKVDKVEWPSPTMVLLARWYGVLPSQLTADLMVFDASCHPNPQAFDAWAEGGPCPYRGEVDVGRAANFSESREVWKTGVGRLVRPYDLMIRLLVEFCNTEAE